MEWYRKANKALEGAPDTTLTAIMLIAGVALIVGAFCLDPALKGLVTAWVVLP